ncbi:hypothetical protein ABEB36_008007 [Hypothenemus hampei]|uniref:Uncharacterized protein n=1 Tax=Hypothenemus hampei TaxID=57062 RepID=A0ABD1EKD4_HYPHA
MDDAFKLKLDNPKAKANVISQLFFAWTVPLFRKGIKRKLQLSDLYKTLNADKSDILGDKLEYNWQRQIDLSEGKPNKKPSLLYALIQTFYFQYSLYGILFFIQYIVLRSPQPIVLAWLVRQFESGNILEDRTAMYTSASILVLISLISIFIMHHGMFAVSIIGMRVRIAVSSLIYRKIMRLNRKSQGETATGRVINILSNDVQRFDQLTVFLHMIWIMPIQVILVTYLMWNMMGIYCLVGIGAMVLIAIPLQTSFGKVASYLRLKVAERCDTRVKHMNEIINGIQVIKMYAWEKPFETLIQYLRAREIKFLMYTSYLRGFFSSCTVFVERLTLFLTVITYTLAGFRISADIVFSMAQFFNILQLAMAIIYPLAVSLAAESWVAIKRLQEILLLEEKQESPITLTSDKTVKIQKVTASWIPNTPVLQDIHLIIPKGKLCAIIGPVGAGKSSILQLLLGELSPTVGTIHIGDSISYASQEPWLFAASVRKNILFGKPYISTLYKKIAEVCALKEDFKQFAYGDRTLVGERGVSLSGGQRARINLARAIYRTADIYLLDDPLSAVDTHVGKHLFEECILKYLEGKTRILVTHQLQYLKKADIIVVLNEGRIEAHGTFDELSANDELTFTKLLAAAEEDDQIENDKDQQTTEKEQHLLKKRMSVFSNSESLKEQTITDDQHEENISYEGATPFKDYLKSVGSWCFVIFVILLFIISMLACTATDYWVAFWTNQEDMRYLADLNKTQSLLFVSYLKEPLSSFTFRSTKISNEDIFDEIITNGTSHSIFKTNVSIYIYTGITILMVFFTIIRVMFFFKMAMIASKNIHHKMFHCLLKAPMRFFDTNPSGRILNRFSKDMGAIDEVLPRVMMDSISIILVMVGIFINVLISNYFMIIAMVLLGLVFMKLRTWYIASAKDIKHLEGIAKSPVFSHIVSSITGLTTIRAAHAQGFLIKQFDEHQDVHTSSWFFTIMCMVSFGLWLDIISVIFIFIVTFGFILIAELGYGANGSLMGLAISQSLILTGMVQHGMRQTCEVINQLTSVERVLQYTKLENEGPFETPPNKRPKDPFPKEGQIEFRNMSLTYVHDEPPVLKNLNLTITSGEKIGIVGRTGAGKSSLISALFNLAPIEGQILIDDVDTKTLGLTDLRRNISIIPQEPVLFSASLRYNLDPFKELDDNRLWNVLEEVELKDLATTLDMQVLEGGSNFSVGQRQLLCLARALLKNNKILILDEATANVDARTDALIQTTIRKKFQNCTVLTIAHRLNTIIDSDKVLVMGNGEVLEFDHPHVLLQNPESAFMKLVKETGNSMTEQLKAAANEAWKIS